MKSVATRIRDHKYYKSGEKFSASMIGSALAINSESVHGAIASMVGRGDLIVASKTLKGAYYRSPKVNLILRKPWDATLTAML